MSIPFGKLRNSQILSQALRNSTKIIIPFAVLVNAIAKKRTNGVIIRPPHRATDRPHFLLSFIIPPAGRFCKPFFGFFLPSCNSAENVIK